MGIKFLCPNGHKLHVKSFLSGKRAICPKCGARVVVPADNTRTSNTETARDDGTSTEPSLELDESQLVELSQAVAISAKPTAPSREVTETTANDPIAEAPGAVWYVRPASGGQFGPASGEIMRGWIKDGRVGASSLVWRDGWSEWRSAAATFPQLGSQLVAPGPAMPQAPLPGAGTSAADLPRGRVAEVLAPSPPPHEVSSSGSVPPLAEMSRKRRRKKDVSLMASAVLVAVTVILIIILALVFRRKTRLSSPFRHPKQQVTRRPDLTPISLCG